MVDDLERAIAAGQLIIAPEPSKESQDQEEHIASTETNLLSVRKIGKQQATNRAAHASAKGASFTGAHQPKKRKRQDLVSKADILLKH